MDIEKLSTEVGEQAKVRARKLAAEIMALVAKLDVDLLDEHQLDTVHTLMAEHVAALIGQTVGRTINPESEKIPRYILLARQLNGAELEAAVLTEI